MPLRRLLPVGNVSDRPREWVVEENDHGVSDDDSFLPAQVLHEERELRDVEIRVVRRLWCI
jgi:hypothetical protein